MAKYIFDKESFDIKKVSRSFSNILWSAAKWIIVTASMAVVYYIIISLFIGTPEERRLRKENRMYEKLYSQLSYNQELIGDVLNDLETRDNDIYNEIFHTEAPSADPHAVLGFNIEQNGGKGKDIYELTENKIDALESVSKSVDDNLKEVFEILASGKNPMPPLESPIEDISYARTGASVGQKINPFYKVMSEHKGLDIIAAQGSPVKASSDGVVRKVSHSGKGLGNVVEIDHGNGYVTIYAHLGSISVSKGQKVFRGKTIASVGLSGNSFAPHLHYEVLKDGKVMDPVNYMFASLSPKEYSGVAYMSVNTEQSLD